MESNLGKKHGPIRPTLMLSKNAGYKVTKGRKGNKGKLTEVQKARTYGDGCCKKCGSKLSIYNPYPYCSICKDSGMFDLIGMRGRKPKG